MQYLMDEININNIILVAPFIWGVKTSRETSPRASTFRKSGGGRKLPNPASFAGVLGNAVVSLESNAIVISIQVARHTVASALLCVDGATVLRTLAWKVGAQPIR
eukprot:SAG11_NODE_4365_length_1931_cov_3.419214_2_plen_105_part_00